MDQLLYVLPLFGLLALVFAFAKSLWVSQRDPGTDQMKELAGHIRDGAMAFLAREYRVLALFVIVVAVFDIHIDKKADAIINPSMILWGDVPRYLTI